MKSYRSFGNNTTAAPQQGRPLQEFARRTRRPKQHSGVSELVSTEPVLIQTFETLFNSPKRTFEVINPPSTPIQLRLEQPPTPELHHDGHKSEGVEANSDC